MVIIDKTSLIFSKVAFHKFLLSHSWIFCLIYDPVNMYDDASPKLDSECRTEITQCTYESLFQSLIACGFYTSWKRQKTFGYLTFSEGIEPARKKCFKKTLMAAL